MKKRKYSKKEIKRFIISGTVICFFDLVVLTLICTGILNGIINKSIVLIAYALFGIGWIVGFYNRIYRPNLQLEALIQEYRNNEKVAIGNGVVTQDDLVQEIKEIITSLDTIAIKQKNAEILMKNAEINNLQDQINPHFLYNTLEVIRGEALVKGDRKIAEMTAALANYFRYNISRKESFVFLKDELKNIMNYFNIQKNRFGEKISCKILYHDITEEEVGVCYIPKLILQPIVENCIYHGLEMKMDKGTIKIHITVADTSLKINVADDGLGMTKEKLDALNCDFDKEKLQEGNHNRHNGVAMMNIRNRLRLYWGDAAYMVVISELGIGTQVHLSMPFIYEKEEYMNK